MCFFEVLTPFPDDFKKWVNVFLISALPETLRINMAATSSAASNNNIMASSPQDSDAWALLSLKEANTMPSPTTTNSSPASHKHINESTNGGQKPALGKWHIWCRIRRRISIRMTFILKLVLVVQPWSDSGPFFRICKQYNLSFTVFRIRICRCELRSIYEEAVW